MNKKFYIVLFSSLLMISNVYTQGTWKSTGSPTDKFLRSVFFTDSLYGWAVGDSGMVIHTTNSGLEWIAQNSNTNNNIVKVFFLNRQKGWAASWNVDSIPLGTRILTTTDGGNNWSTQVYPDENIFIQSILYTDSLNGWMGGKPHALVRTSDGGSTWQQEQIDSTIFAFFPVLSIKFFNDQIGFASGGAFEAAGVMWRTTNGGDNWFVIDPLQAPPDPIHQFLILNSLDVIGVGGDFEIFGVSITRSYNGGLSWQNENLGIQGVAFDVESRTDNEFWAALGSQRNFIYTLDTASTWMQISTPDSAAIYDMAFPDSMHGFAVGKGGVILKYTPPRTVAIETGNNDTPKNYCLFQNFPNPFNPSTKIKFEIPGQTRNNNLNVILKIFDILGNEVATLVNEEKPAGNYEVIFNTVNLSSGIYFYKLNAGDFTATKKMVLIR